jgi:predicted DNA-binding transcriptional regulator AlpA
MESLLLYVEEFAALMGMPIRTVYNKVHTKHPSIPRPRYNGKHPVWLRSEIQAHIENLPLTPPPRKKPKLKKSKK